MNTKRTAILVVSVATLVATSSTYAATNFWKTNFPTGNWSTNSNWSNASASGVDTGGPPLAGEPVNIVHTNGAAHTVTLDTTTPALGLLTVDLTGAGTTVNTLSLTTNVTLSAAGVFVGGHTGAGGTGATNGRGALFQSAGVVAPTAGSTLVLAHGAAGTAGSIGTYTLSGTGAVIAPESEYIGLYGSGTFHHQAGTNTLSAGGAGNLHIGVFAGATGTYNLSYVSGTGAFSQIISNKPEVVGDFGTGIFNHTGGWNTINGANNLILGNNTGGVGTYTISGTTSRLTVGNNIQVGNAGVGTLNIQDNSSVYVTNGLIIFNLGTVNMQGGTLRFNTATGLSRFFYTGGTIQLAGNRALGFDAESTAIFGFSPSIPAGKVLWIEGSADIEADTTITGGSLRVDGDPSFPFHRIGDTTSPVDVVVSAGGDVLFSTGAVYVGLSSTSADVSLTVTGSGSTFTNNADLFIGRDGDSSVRFEAGAVVTSGANVQLAEFSTAIVTATVTGAGTSWHIGSDLVIGNNGGAATLNIEDNALVYVTDELKMNGVSRINLNGGTLRYGIFGVAGPINFTAGGFQLPGDHNVGDDPIIDFYYDEANPLPTGKLLTIEGTATLVKPLTIAGGKFKANAIAIGTGGALDFDRGVLETTGGAITGLTSLNIPTNGEFRSTGTHSLRITGAAGSTITATGALALGSSSLVNGFATQGTLNVGANTVTLNDANDVVFDSLALATLGSGASPGTLSAANGLTLDFGGNLTGFGTVSTPNNIAKRLINNGHIIGNSPAQKITLPGYVKGVGTFDQVNFTGTFSPGFSPAITIAGSVSFSPTSTLIMELGGTAPGSGYDQLQASGALSLGGVLQISLINNFIPSPGQQFNILDWGSLAGTFSSLSLPTLAGPTWNISQLYTSGIISVDTGLLGDFNNDGNVDSADYLPWRINTANSPLPNDNGLTTQAARFNLWRAGFGSTVFTGSGAESGSNVPEPASFALTVIAVLFAVTCRRVSALIVRKEWRP